MRTILRTFVLAFIICEGVIAAEDPRQIIGEMIASGQYDQARSYLTSHNGTLEDKVLLEAEIAVAEGDYGKAIKHYRALVAKYPNNAGLRVALAKLLISNRNYQSAEFHIRELSNRVSDPTQKAALVKEANQIGQYDKFGVSGSFSLTPSTNINNANDDATNVINNIFTGEETEYDVPDELLPQFGWRATAGISAFLKQRISDNQELVLRGSLSATRYTVPTLDNESMELSFTWSHQTARNTFNITPYLRRYMGDDEIYSTSFGGDVEAIIVDRDEDYWTKGVRLYAERRFKNARSLYFSGQYGHNIYDDEEQGYAESDNFSMRLGYSFMVNERNRASLWVGRIDRVEVGRGDYISPNNYTGYNIGGSLETLFKEGIRTKFSLNYASREHEIPPYFSFVDYVREDYTTSLSFEFSNQNWTIGRFLPVLNCQYSINNSTFTEYERNGGSCGLNVTQNF